MTSQHHALEDHLLIVPCASGQVRVEVPCAHRLRERTTKCLGLGYIRTVDLRLPHALLLCTDHRRTNDTEPIYVPCANHALTHLRIVNAWVSKLIGNLSLHLILALISKRSDCTLNHLTWDLLPFPNLHLQIGKNRLQGFLRNRWVGGDGEHPILIL